MTHKTNLPQPLDDTIPWPQALLPEAQRLVAVYLRTLSSPQTIKTYNTELTLFISFLEDEMGKGLGGLTAEDISLYREHLIGAYAAATAAKKLAVLRRVLIFTFMAGATTVNPEALRFFPKSPRVRQGPPYNVLTERSFTSHPDSRKPIFTSRVGKDKQLTTRSVQNIVKKYVRAAGITKAISPHSIRHTVGTNMAVNEAPLLVIQQFLGHSDPKTTLRYIRRAEELATRAYQYNTLPL